MAGGGLSVGVALFEADVFLKSRWARLSRELDIAFHPQGCAVAPLGFFASKAGVTEIGLGFG
ncbi:hypothetical protein VI26_18955 [Chromobacterium sp. LK1]|nr:hypothetical protein VI26_18955 [Chromobacterium sp. LK1]